MTERQRRRPTEERLSAYLAAELQRAERDYPSLPPARSTAAAVSISVGVLTLVIVLLAGVILLRPLWSANVGSDAAALAACRAAATEKYHNATVVGAFATTVGGVRGLPRGTNGPELANIPGEREAIACYLDGDFAGVGFPGIPPYHPDRALVVIVDEDILMIARGFSESMPIVAPVPPGETPPPTPEPSFNARACTGSDLRAQLGDGTANLSHVLLPVVLQNVSDTVCALVGYPTLDGVTLDGAAESITVGHGGWFGDPGRPGVLAPNGIGFGQVNIEGGTACPAYGTGSQVYATLRLGFPGGGSVDVPGSSFDTICGVGVSAFGVISAPTTTAFDTDAADVLGRYLDALVARDCPTALALATADFASDTNAFCAGSTRIVVLAVDPNPSLPDASQVEFTLTIRTSGGDVTLQDGSHTWFYTLTRQQDGAWRVSGGGGGP